MKRDKHGDEMKKDVFDEALEQVIENHNTTAKSSTMQDNNIVLTDKNMSKIQARNWGELQHAMENGHVERFNNVLNNLPDREFARFFLKALPFFKPSAPREPVNPAAVLQSITINIHKTDKAEPEIKTVDIK